MQSMAKRQTELELAMKGTRNTIQQLEQPQKELIVSDHAILRYLQRKMKVPVDSIRVEILDTLKHVDRDLLGKTSTVCGFVIQGNAVVTYKI